MARKSTKVRALPTSRPGEPQIQELVVLKLSVDPEVARLLRLEAFGRDCSLGQFVAEMLRAQPRRFILMDRGVKGSKGSIGGEGPNGSNAPGAQGEVQALGLLAESA